MLESFRFNILGTLYVIFAPDGCGKTEITKRVIKLLEADGYKVVHLTMPSESIWGRAQKKILRKKGTSKKAAFLGLLDFLALVPYIEGARFIKNKINGISSEKLSEGLVDVLRENANETNEFAKAVYIMERHPIFDALGYMPSILKNPLMKFISYLIAKPGMAIRVDCPPDVAYQRILNRGEQLEKNETLENLIKASENFGDIAVPGVEIKTVYNGENTDLDAAAYETYRLIKSHKRKLEKHVREGYNRLLSKAYDLLGCSKDYFRREG